MFRLLRKRGAVLDTLETGGEALRISVEKGSESMVKLLLEEGVEATSNLVDVALQQGHEEIAMVLRTDLVNLL
jgi:hypothetical protein